MRKERLKILLIYRIRSFLIEVSASAVFLLPILFLLDKLCFHNKKKTALYLAFTLYLSAVYYITGLPTVSFFRFAPVFNYILLLDIRSDSSSAVLNIILFVPLGLILSMLWDGFRKFKSTMLFGLSMSCVIEILQIFTLRATDINDILTNTAGTLIGYMLATVILKCFPRYIHPRSKRIEVYMMCFITVLVMFFFQPYVSAAFWKVVQ